MEPREVQRQDRIAAWLSWGATALSVLYLVWGTYQLTRQIRVLAQLLVGLGSELPAAARFVMSTSRFALWPAAFLLILAVIGKELLVRDLVVRLAITFLVFLLATWFFGFALSSMLEPVVGVLEKIG